MQRRRRHTVFALLATLALLPMTERLGAQGYEYTLDDWMTVSRVGSFVWAPDGGTIYFTSNAAPSGTYEIFRVSSDGGAPVQLSRNRADVRPEPVSDLSVSRDGRRLIFTSARYFQGYDNIYTLPTSGGVPEPVTFNDAVIETGPDLSADGRTLAFFARTRRGTRIYLKDIESPTAWPRALLPDPEHGERYPVFSPDGRRLAFSRGGDIWVTDVNDPAPRRIIEGAYAGGNGSPVWSPDGSRIAFTTDRSGFSQVGVVDVASGTVTPITLTPQEHGSVSWSPDGRWLALVRNTGLGMSQEVVIVAADGSGDERVLSRGEGMRSSPEFSPDGRWVAFLETTTTRTRDIWKAPVSGGEPVQVTSSMGRVDPADLSEGEEVTYPGADNLPIPTMLFKPWDFDPARKYPVIVRIHGHPGQWNQSMDLMDQYFLERGFVIVKPNPRGSRDFGQGFHDLHIADYGGAEFDDIMRVLPFLESLGYVDMTRKATWGGSGGGYMSFVISTKAPDAFEAQVIRAPVSDWGLLAIDRYGASGRAWKPTREPRRERSEFGGSEEEIPEEYHDRSPINFVENVTVPQLLLQGLRDSSVPPRQAQVWADRMRELGKDDLLTYVEYPDEDHGLRRYKATVRDRIERMERFFAEHLRLPRLASGP